MSGWPLAMVAFGALLAGLAIGALINRSNANVSVRIEARERIKSVNANAVRLERNNRDLNTRDRARLMEIERLNALIDSNQTKANANADAWAAALAEERARSDDMVRQLGEQMLGVVKAGNDVPYAFRAPVADVEAALREPTSLINLPAFEPPAWNASSSTWPKVEGETPTDDSQLPVLAAAVVAEHRGARARFQRPEFAYSVAATVDGAAEAIHGYRADLVIVDDDPYAQLLNAYEAEQAAPATPRGTRPATMPKKTYPAPKQRSTSRAKRKKNRR